MRVLDDLRGGTDAHGNPLSATVVATADELAAAGDLVKGKAAGLPVAVVRGLRATWWATGDRRGGARPGARSPRDDMFRLGTSEAVREAVTAAAHGPGVHRRAGRPAVPCGARSPRP